MQTCGIRNEGSDHEFVLKLSLIGIKVLNRPQIIKYTQKKKFSQ